SCALCRASRGATRRTSGPSSARRLLNRWSIDRQEISTNAQAAAFDAGEHMTPTNNPSPPIDLRRYKKATDVPLKARDIDDEWRTQSMRRLPQLKDEDGKELGQQGLARLVGCSESMITKIFRLEADDPDRAI